MNPPVDLSIIIVNYNTCDLLRECLSSIYENTGTLAMEVFVVDNASEDGSSSMVKTDFPQVVLIENSKNVGFAKANNQAIRRSQGRFVLLLNSDTIVVGDALPKMVRFLAETPQAGVVGCKLLNSDLTIQHTIKHFPTLVNTVSRYFYLSRLFPFSRMKMFIGTIETDSYYEDIHRVEFLLGACLMVKHQVIEDVGLLDEDFFLYGEETDWCYRIKKAGWEIFYYPHAQIIHHRGQSVKATQKERWWVISRHLKAEYQFIAKHHSALYTGCYTFIISLKYGIAYLKNMILARIFSSQHRQYYDLMQDYRVFLGWLFSTHIKWG
ncbi:MAG: glycosyltransferase family 2 protein [Gemmatimonadetes bacterium]|nr:MAG: glycosyltransferase family 2 protein [Gemmatimonadota bacterium]